MFCFLYFFGVGWGECCHRITGVGLSQYAHFFHLISILCCFVCCTLFIFSIIAFFLQPAASLSLSVHSDMKLRYWFFWGVLLYICCRGICTPTDSATTCGPSSYKTRCLRVRNARRTLVGLRSWHATRSCWRNEMPKRAQREDLIFIWCSKRGCRREETWVWLSMEGKTEHNL